VRFFPGFHCLADVIHLDAAFISVNRFYDRVSGFDVGDWIADSGAFTTVTKHGGYPHPVKRHADVIKRYANNGNLLIAVAEDWMCEEDALAKTGKTVAEHQRLTIDRFDRLRDCDTGGVPIMPVLQGWTMGDYADHVEAYGDRLAEGAWVGVGSVCKRNKWPIKILRILDAIHQVRPDLKLHGFGLKGEALMWQPLRDQLHTADSFAWSFAARRQGRDRNSWREAKAFADAIAAGGD
jgi:hypothetical protein